MKAVDNVNKKVLSAFGGVLLAVMLLKMNLWHLALIALLGAAGYALMNLDIGRRWREMMRRRS